MSTDVHWCPCPWMTDHCTYHFSYDQNHELSSIFFLKNIKLWICSVIMVGCVQFLSWQKLSIKLTIAYCCCKGAQTPGQMRQRGGLMGNIKKLTYKVQTNQKMKTTTR